MSMPPLRMQHWLLFGAIAIAFFAWGGWLMRSTSAPEPLPGVARWQKEILLPMAEGALTLGELNAVSSGELWLKPRLDGPQLLFRSQLGDTGEQWKLEAALVLTEQEHASLMTATGLKPNDPEQPLSSQLLTELRGHRLSVLTLRPQQPVAENQVAATFGAPRLRLQLNSGEGWVYPVQGLTAHVEDGTLLLLHVVPRSSLKQ